MGHRTSATSAREACLRNDRSRSKSQPTEEPRVALLATRNAAAISCPRKLSNPLAELSHPTRVDKFSRF
jgi:hypothetical protein